MLERADKLESGQLRVYFCYLYSDFNLITLYKSYDQHYIVNRIYKFIHGVPLVYQLLKSVSSIFCLHDIEISLVKNRNVNTMLTLHLSFNTIQFPRFLCTF